MRFPLIGRKARRDARPAYTRYPVTSFSTWASGGDHRSYEAMVREGYVGNPIAQRAVRLVAESAGSAPIIAHPGDHPVLPLLSRPNPIQAGPDLIEVIASHLSLHGNAFIEFILGENGEPSEVYALRPDRVSIEADANGWPIAYLYKAEDGVERFPAEGTRDEPGLLHIKTFHPLDDHYGLGSLGAAVGAIETHNAAARWNKNLLENAARPSGALVFDPGEPGATLTAEQFARLKAEMELSFAGAANAGRPMLLEGGLRWQSLSLSPAELDFVGAKASAAREIALAFGVPPMLLGLPGDNTYANYQEANRALWRLTLLPLLNKILSALTGHLSLWWPELSIDIDRNAIPALSADRERLWRYVAPATFLSDEEKRALLGLQGEPSS